MEAEPLVDLFHNTQLRQFIIDSAGAMTPDKKAQKDLVGYCWCKLSESKESMSIDYYKRLCTACMAGRYFEITRRGYVGGS